MAATDAALYSWTTEQFVTKYVAAKPAKLHIVILRDVYRLTAAGQELLRIDYQKTEQGRIVYESFVCLRRKGFFVSWTFVSLSPDEVNQIADSVKTASFR